MDPDEALAQARVAASLLSEQLDAGDVQRLQLDDVESLVMAFVSLDAWLKSGGYLPAAWTKGQQ